MRSAVRDPVELCRRLGLPSHYEAAAVRAARQFPVFVPKGYLARMRPGDPHDPLLRQVLPLAEEEYDVPGFSADPLHEAAAERAPGLLQKYTGRALLVTTGACAIHCRWSQTTSSRSIMQTTKIATNDRNKYVGKASQHRSNTLLHGAKRWRSCSISAKPLWERHPLRHTPFVPS